MKTEQLLRAIRESCTQHADEQRASAQQAYMKSSMPFWGIAKPLLTKLCKPLITAAKPANRHEYQSTIIHIFTHATHREEWYAGILYARHWKVYITAESIPTYLEIIRKTQWWDIVDEVATHLVGKSLTTVTSKKDYLLAWIYDDNLWIRRTALLAQLNYKENTDFDLLAQLIRTTAQEKEFFIRKAIGWVLRQHSKHNPNQVQHFITQYHHELSPLSVREGLKIINNS